MDQKVVSTASIVKAPKCYVPVTIPRVLVTEEDSGDFSSVSDSSGATGSEKDDSTDENKVNIRASSIPRPRAVISSPGKMSYFTLFFVRFTCIPLAFCNWNI